MKKKYDIAIIGAGAAGLMAALPLAAYSREHFEEQPTVSVALIDRNPEAGKKLLETGKGRCNFSNAAVLREQYDTKNPEELRVILNRMDPEQLSELFAQYGISTEQDEAGRFYPANGNASFIRDALEEGNESEDVDRLYGFPVKELIAYTDATKDEDGDGRPDTEFRILSENGREVFARKVILATGGKADPKSGSQGDGYRWARNLHHTIVPIHPALVRMTHEDPVLKTVKGVRVKGKAALYRDGILLEEREGEIQLNPGILSGICVMDLAHNVFDVRNHSFDVTLTFTGEIPNRLRVAMETGVGEETAGEYLDRKRPYTLHISGTKGWKEAQVTAGGVMLSETDPLTLESGIVPGLYFAGEILDATGPCGGFNLHWAWTTGFLAGMSAMKAVLGERIPLELQMREEEDPAEEALL